MSSTQPLVSVIIPVHNGERYLAHAIESVLSQTYSHTELIIIDDGSTDASATIVRTYGEQARYLPFDRGNTGSARNYGVTHAGGDYYAFLDQDDVWVQNKLALQLAEFDAHPRLEAVFGQVVQFREATGASAASNSSPPVQGFAPSVMLIRQAAFRRIGPFATDLRLGEWVDWCVRAFDAGLCYRELDIVVARRRVHTQNKGVLQREARVEYARVLKASLDRRGAAGGQN